MIVRILVSADGYRRGVVMEVDSHSAAELILKGIAEEVKESENAKSKKAQNALLAAKHRAKNYNQ